MENAIEGKQRAVYHSQVRFKIPINARAREAALATAVWFLPHVFFCWIAGKRREREESRSPPLLSDQRGMEGGTLRNLGLARRDVQRE